MHTQMLKILPFCFGLLAAPAAADINAVIDDHIIANAAAFKHATAEMAVAAQMDCTPAGVKDAYHNAFDAWVRASHIRFGPVANNGEGMAIAFWPDKKGKIAKMIFRMIKHENPVVHDPVAFAKYSVAARGFFTLEQLLYVDKFSNYSADSYTCAFTRAITVDLARIADETHAGWVGGFDEILRTSGAEGNAVFLTEKEGPQALFTSLLGGLEYIHRQQLGRPLNKLEHRRPKRAEAWRSNRSLRNIVISLKSLQEMAGILAGNQAGNQAWKTLESFKETIIYAKTLEDDVFSRIKEDSASFQIEYFLLLVDQTYDITNTELGAQMGVVAGFNALDGD